MMIYQIRCVRNFELILLVLMTMKKINLDTSTSTKKIYQSKNIPAVVRGFSFIFFVPHSGAPDWCRNLVIKL